MSPQNEQNDGGNVELLTAEQVADIYNGHSEGKIDIGVDPQGRVRSLRHDDTDTEGVSLRKRRAWYAR